MQDNAARPAPAAEPAVAATAASPPAPPPEQRPAPLPARPARKVGSTNGAPPAQPAAPPQEPATKAAPPTRPRRLGMRETWPLWVGLGALLLALLATGALADETARPGAMLALIGVGALGVVAWGGQRPIPGLAAARSGPLVVWDRERIARLAGLGLAAVVVWRADVTFVAEPGETFGRAGWLWLMGIALLVCAAAGWPGRDAAPRPGAPRPRLDRAGRIELLAVGGLFALALILRLWDLRDYPFAIHPDEILTGRAALSGYSGEPGASIFTTLWPGIDLPALWFVAVAGALKLGGGTLAALRLLAALFGAATILPVYGIIRGAWGRTAALAGAAILAFSASNLQFSRVTVNNIVTPFFWAVCFFFLLRGLRGKRPLDWALAGLAGGLSEYSFYGTRLLPFLLLAFLSYLLLAHWRRGWEYLGHWAVLALGYLAGFGPLLATFLLRPGLYFGRGQEGLTWNHIPTSGADLQLMWNTLWPPMVKNLLGFSTTIDQGTFYWGALLLPAEAALLALGAALLLWRWRRPADFLLLMVGVGVLFVGGTLVGGMPFMQHWTPAFPAYYAAIGAPVGALAASLPAGARRLRRAGAGALAVALLALGLANVDYYFHRYEAARPEFELQAAQSRWEAALGRNYVVRTLGWTWKPYDAETNQYLIQGQDGGTIYNPAAQLPLPGLTGQGIGFVFNADEEQYHAVARALYPGGVDQETVSRGAGHVHQFNTYTVSPTQAASVYGAQLDLVAADGRAYRWSGKVDRVGQLPPGASGALRARWSAAVYLPHTTAYQLTVDGAAGQLLIDGKPGPAASAVLPQGWRRVVITADLTSARPLRLLVAESGGKPAEVAHNALWAVGPTAGLLRVSAGAAGAAPVQSVDPFIGFSSLSDPRWPGPAQGAAQPARVRWSGELLAPADGQYGFSVHTDGQARLRIDGQDALTGCGSPDAAQSHIPDTVQGGATLKAGWRRIEFDYIAQPGHDVAELFWAPPNGASELIPMSALRFAPEDNLLAYTAPQPPEAIDCAATTSAPPAPPAPIGPTLVVPSAILGAGAGLKAPRGLAVDAGGQIFVADSGNARIVRLDSTGNVTASWTSPAGPGGAGAFGLIGDIATTPDGRVVTLDADTGDALAFQADGTLVTRWPGVAPRGNGLAAGPDGSLWVAHTGGSRVLRLTPGGGVDAPLLGGPDGSASRLDQPVDVAVGPDGATYVVDLKGRIAQLDTRGAVTRQWPVDVGISLGGSRLAVWNGRVIMSDPDRARIDVLNPASGQIRYIGGEGAGAGQFRAPTGVAAGADGRLYVLDSGNARIQVFTILGSP